MDESFARRTIEHYADKWQRHGATPLGVDWNGETSQLLHFEQLAKLVSDLFEGLQKKYGNLENPSEEEIKAIQADIAVQADALLAGIDLGKLDDEQLSAVEPVIGMSSKGRETMVRILNERAKQPTIEGFRAAVKALMMSPRGESAAAALNLLEHPAFGEALGSDESLMVFDMIPEDVSAEQRASRQTRR